MGPSRSAQREELYTRETCTVRRADGGVRDGLSTALSGRVARLLWLVQRAAVSLTAWVATQWSIWAALELETLARDLLGHRDLLPEFAREASHAERDELLLQKPLGVLNGALVGREYLLGNDFTVADLNVAAILRWAKIAGLDFSSVPEVERWLDVCLARPACGRMRDMARPT